MLTLCRKRGCTGPEYAHSEQTKERRLSKPNNVVEVSIVRASISGIPWGLLMAFNAAFAVAVVCPRAYAMELLDQGRLEEVRGGTIFAPDWKCNEEDAQPNNCTNGCLGKISWVPNSAQTAACDIQSPGDRCPLCKVVCADGTEYTQDGCTGVVLAVLRYQTIDTCIGCDIGDRV